MGQRNDDKGNPGGDCSGTVVSVSDGVTAFAPGDDVFGITEGCVRTYRNTDALLLDRKPASCRIVVREPSGGASRVCDGVSEGLGPSVDLGATSCRPGTRLEAEGISLTVLPLLADQRSRTTAALQASSVCWRGTCSAEGVLGGQPVAGWATVEAAGTG